MNPDHSSRFVTERDGSTSWRQTLDPLEAHVVDHGGLLWVWQPSGGYRVVPYDNPIFYDLREVYDDDPPKT